MIAHEAFWVFAEKEGNKYAKKYSQDRKLLATDERKKRDSAWLLGKGGVRLRKEWLKLPNDTRLRLMSSLPAQHAFTGTTGIIDERKTSDKHSASDVISTKSASAFFLSNDRDSICRKGFELYGPMEVGNRPQLFDTSTENSVELMESLRHFNTNRSLYHSVLLKEERVLAQIAYDTGSMTGVLDAFVTMVESSIQLARYKDKCKSSDEAFGAVARRMIDVFASFRGMTSFAPEHLDEDEAPSEAFARTRIEKARKKYEAALTDLYSIWTKQHDPDAPLLPSSSRFFGKPDGFPKFNKQQ